MISFWGENRQKPRRSICQPRADRVAAEPDDRTIEIAAQADPNAAPLRFDLIAALTGTPELQFPTMLFRKAQSFVQRGV